MTYDMRSSTDFADSTTFDQQHPLPDQALPDPPPTVDGLKIEIDMEEDIANLVSDAHMKTCQKSASEIAALMARAQHNLSRQPDPFSNMVSPL